jgi:hypothetical protein
MSEEARSSPAHSPTESASPPAESPIPFNIGEEFGTASKNLPPVKIVLGGLAALLLVAGVVTLVQRRQPATGTIDHVVVAPVPGQKQVMVAIGISLHNHGKKPYVLHQITAEMASIDGDFSDEAAAAVDCERYFQAFPILQDHALSPLKLESRIEPGGELAGTIIVSFPVDADQFTNRKSLAVAIAAEDQPEPLLLKK